MASTTSQSIRIDRRLFESAQRFVDKKGQARVTGLNFPAIVNMGLELAIANLAQRWPELAEAPSVALGLSEPANGGL